MSKRLILILAAILALGVSGAVQCQDAQNAADRFARLDVNHDGFLTPDELGRPRLFKLLDTNQDGKISKDEGKTLPEKAEAKDKQARNANLPLPTQADVKYGIYPRNVLDFWQAKSDKPTPLVVFIHGGGFRIGDKTGVPGATLKTALDSGASFMSISYRFLPSTPIQDILRDCARSVQYVRANAAKFNIDPKKIACFGGSAGAGASLWLATHDDLADPKSDDPVLRESTRISAAACVMGQATYDLPEWERIIYPFKPEWRDGQNEIPEFYGFKDKAELESERGRKITADCSMYSLLTKDDAPIWMSCNMADGEPTGRGHLLHHPKHMQVIKKRGDEVGVKVETHGKEIAGDAWVKATEFLLKELKKP